MWSFNPHHPPGPFWKETGADCEEQRLTNTPVPASAPLLTPLSVAGPRPPTPLPRSTLPQPFPPFPDALPLTQWPQAQPPWPPLFPHPKSEPPLLGSSEFPSRPKVKGHQHSGVPGREYQNQRGREMGLGSLTWRLGTPLLGRGNRRLRQFGPLSVLGS